MIGRTRAARWNMPSVRRPDSRISASVTAAQVVGMEVDINADGIGLKVFAAEVAVSCACREIRATACNFGRLGGL